MKPSIGLIGLKVMGSNLARNIESRGYPVAVFNRDGRVTDAFIELYKQHAFSPAKTLSELAALLQPPRQIFMMIQAGSPVDSVTEALLPFLSSGDILIDGGNSYFKDTMRREQRCREHGVHFLGIGISGGEEGALKGPSIMPGGAREAWAIVAPLLEKIAAQAGGPCTDYMGPDGAGHFVKMVHNGIEYGDMQLIAEIYHLLREAAKAAPPELAEIFAAWNKGALSSYLIEITAQIFRRRDDEGSGFLVDKVLDKAGQKGTGRWTVAEALDLGVPIPTLAAALDARGLSSMREERLQAGGVFGPMTLPYDPALKREALIKAAEHALYCAKILSYAQGMALLGRASRHYNWDLKLDRIAAIWKGGCIIRAQLLKDIESAFRRTPALPNLMLDSEFSALIADTIPSLRQAVGACVACGIPAPALGGSLAYFDAYRSVSLPQNLSQAQRDYFGAHTYERIDRPGVFHTDWQA